MNTAIPLYTNPDIYPLWKSYKHICIHDINSAKDIQYKYFIKNQNVSFMCFNDLNQFNLFKFRIVINGKNL